MTSPISDVSSRTPHRRGATRSFVTKNPSAFMEKARTWQPTVIMLDLGMPGTDGVQLLRGLGREQCTVAQVILISGA
jgi:DNA-binding response OmpR family regulator